FIRRLRDIAAIEGVNVSLGPNDDARKQGQDIRGGLNNPQAVVEGARIRSRQDSPFALELRAKPLANPKEVAQPRPAALEKGHAFVRIDKGELYELVFHNGARHEVALSITIDGIDTFTFSDDRDPKTDAPAFSHWLVSPGQTLVLPGWHKTNDPKRDDNFLSFLVTEYGQGAGSKFPTKSQGQIGVITVQISKSHQPRSGQAKSGAETGFGPPVKGELKAVERLIDPPLDFITVRYLR
ncbi:MAG: hypothetical protein KDA71_18330, partial [Planctomycetales bacterium]|nr:hypothetical protein [Planctomycetales bacterium]